MVNKVDWSTYKFHCSCLPKLMVSGKGKDEALGETAKSYLKEVWIEEVLGRKSFENVNKYTLKGTEVESDTIEMASNVLGETLFKNKEELSNAFIIGTPDINMPDSQSVDDAKSSWDAQTFYGVSEKKARTDYYWQVVGYMILTGKKKARLIYGLVDTPLGLIESELYKMSYTLTDQQIEEARKNFVFDDIPEAMRIKVYTFDFSPEDEQRIQLQVLAARRYLEEMDVINKLTV